MMNEKAVSEAIGFVLILGIVISGIGLVTLYGYPVLVKEQSNTDVKNMERAMIVIQNDMKSLCFKNVPYKETSLQVSGGTLEVIDAGSSAPTFEISCDGFGPVEFHPGGLVYRSDRGTEVITLENGAVMKRQEDSTGSVMLAEPRWFYDVNPVTGEKTFVIYIMNISTDETTAKSGMATVRMSLEGTIPHMPPGDAVDVMVRYTGDTENDLTTAWENYLTGGSPGMSGSGGIYTLAGVKKLIVKEYRIKIHGV